MTQVLEIGETRMSQLSWVADTKVDVAPATKTILSWDDSQPEILRKIFTIYNGGRGVACDPTYSIGEIYKGLPQPPLKFDIDPQVPGVEQADARNLPLEDNSVDSMLMDLPFLWGRSKTGVMKERFTKLPTMKDLLDLYRDAIKEAYRVLAPKSILIFKTQNVVSSGRKWPISYRVMAYAEEAGFIYEDDPTLIRYSPMSQKHMYTNGQQHMRSATCLFMLFRKGKLSLREKQARARGVR